MKKFVLLLILIFCQTFIYGQTKVYEYAATDSDSESGMVVSFLNELDQNPKSKGLIVIYAGENRERLGNILAFANGLKRYLGIYSSKDKVSVVIAEGKQIFFKDWWIISEGAEYPKIKAFDFDFSNLKTKYFYAEHCLDCSPAVPQLAMDIINLEYYADALKKNNDYQGVIDIILNNYTGWSQKKRLKDAQEDAVNFRQVLTKEFGLKNKRLTIRIKKSTTKDSPAMANLYIVPKAFKNKN